jgi:phosphate transport system substrate-binding protein
VGRLRLTPVAALLAAGSLALAACGSSGGSSNDTAANSGSLSNSASCFSGTLNASGSTAQTNAMTTWIKDYQKSCSGATINYNSVGSGQGITDFTGGQTDFAGSDAALNPTAGEVAAAQKRCASAPLDLPMVVGPIAIGYKLSGVSKLVLDGPTLAKIFLGQITTWNNAAIVALNKGVNLPSTKITPFYRSDSSGTTANFEKYLAATAPSIFTATPDKDSSSAHFGGQGKTGSQGVAQATSTTEGGIGYFEYSYAVQSGLSTVNIDNGAGAVTLSPDSASATIASAPVVGKGSDLTLSINYATKTAGAYPIVLVTYEVVCSKYGSAATGTKVKDFLTYVANGGQGSLKQQGYAPLPSALQQKVVAAISSIS